MKDRQAATRVAASFFVVVAFFFFLTEVREVGE